MSPVNQRLSTMLQSAAVALTLIFANQQLCEGQIRFPGASGGPPGRRPTGRPQVGDVSVRAKSCPPGQLSFAGGCHAEFTRGAPCPGSQWLVKSPTDATVGQCQLRPCPAENQFLWTLPGLPAKTCAPRTFGAGKCLSVKPNQKSYTDAEAGVGGCDCNADFVYWPLDDRCYRLFQRGPCADGEVLIFDPEEKFLSCQTNPCDEENFVFWTDGQCYELETGGPCPDETFLRVNSNTLTVECSTLDLKQLITLSSNCPTGTKRDFNGTCTQMTFMGSGSPRPCEKGFIRKPDGSCVKWFR